MDREGKLLPDVDYVVSVLAQPLREFGCNEAQFRRQLEDVMSALYLHRADIAYSTKLVTIAGHVLIFARGDDYRAFQTVANLSLLVTPPERPALQDLDGQHD